MNKGIS